MAGYTRLEVLAFSVVGVLALVVLVLDLAVWRAVV
jgi:uncharacterized membrane protein